jgi:hypothetical protein
VFNGCIAGLLVEWLSPCCCCDNRLSCWTLSIRKWHIRS